MQGDMKSMQIACLYTQCKPQPAFGGGGRLLPLGSEVSKTFQEHHLPGIKVFGGECILSLNGKNQQDHSPSKDIWSNNEDVIAIPKPTSLSWTILHLLLQQCHLRHNRNKKQQITMVMQFTADWDPQGGKTRRKVLKRVEGGKKAHSLALKFQHFWSTEVTLLTTPPGDQLSLTFLFEIFCWVLSAAN